MDAELLRQLQDRGRFFYERFPGAAAAEEWKRMREKAEQHHAARTQMGGGPQDEKDVSRGSPIGKPSSSRDTYCLPSSAMRRKSLSREPRNRQKIDRGSAVVRSSLKAVCDDLDPPAIANPIER